MPNRAIFPYICAIFIVKIYSEIITNNLIIKTAAGVETKYTPENSVPHVMLLVTTVNGGGTLLKSAYFQNQIRKIFLH